MLFPYVSIYLLFSVTQSLERLDEFNQTSHRCVGDLGNNSVQKWSLNPMR